MAVRICDKIENKSIDYSNDVLIKNLNIIGLWY